MCVYKKTVFSLSAEYGTHYTQNSLHCQVRHLAVFAISSWLIATLTPRNEEHQQENLLTINPYTCRLTIQKYRGRSSDLFRLECLPNYLSGDSTPNTYPSKDRNLQQQVLFRILTEFPFHPSYHKTLRGTICTAKIVNNSIAPPFSSIFFKKTLSI